VRVWQFDSEKSDMPSPHFGTIFSGDVVIHILDGEVVPEKWNETLFANGYRYKREHEMFNNMVM